MTTGLMSVKLAFSPQLILRTSLPIQYSGTSQFLAVFSPFGTFSAKAGAFSNLEDYAAF